jgi:cytochrome c peroxidase
MKYMLSPRRFIIAISLIVSACVPGGDAAQPDAGAPATDTVGPDGGLAGTPAGDRDQSGYGDSVFSGGLDPSNPFFAALGTNGRSCATCHVRAAGWTITPAEVRARFTATGGADPLFRLKDGANSPRADVSTPDAMQRAYSMLLARAVIRIGLPVPPDAEFSLAAVDDPYGFASAAELSLFRRPLPSTNLPFLSSVMWDGREPSLGQQAADATTGHAQASSVDPAQMAAIVAFERSISTAQSFDTVAGAFDASGGRGGPALLASVGFQLGENDPLGGSFNRNVFALYGAWDVGPGGGGTTAADRQASIARGERIFNNRPITITNVAGLNDLPGRATLQGSCSTCHNAPGAGSHSTALFLDLGLNIPPRRTPDMPLYTLRRASDGTQRQTTDPGVALVTGRWADLNKFKVPVLRGLAMRPPYFHDGSAPSLQAVVGFYDARFRLGLSPPERADLVAFLQSL